MMTPILQMRKPRQGGGKEDPRGCTTYEAVPADWNCHHRGAWLGTCPSSPAWGLPVTTGSKESVFFLSATHQSTLRRDGSPMREKQKPHFLVR